MAWNQPGNNGQDRDPWGSSNNNGGNSGGNNNKGGRDQGPPDLDDIFRKLSKKLSSLGGKGSGSGGNGASHGPGFSGRVVGIAVVAVVVIWAASGFYTIKEAERGVVTRLGKLSHIVQPGLNWKPTFIDEVVPVNVEAVRELAASGVMLTSDENVVRVEMNVQYRVTDPAAYLFSVTNPDDSLRQATDSAVRGVIGKYTMDKSSLKAVPSSVVIPNVCWKKRFVRTKWGLRYWTLTSRLLVRQKKLKRHLMTRLLLVKTNNNTFAKQKPIPTKFNHVLMVRRSVC